MEIKDIISNVEVYDLVESIIASGYPARTKDLIHHYSQKDIDRAQKLVKATKSGNNAHAQFLTGIRVNFDLTFTNKAWVEAERYRFLEFVSSQSTMHCITKFDLESQYIEYVDPRIIEIIREKVNEYNALKAAGANTVHQKYLEILYSNPAGFKLTARMTTNYRCLRNIYLQRKDHSLEEWQVFCQWIEKLPLAEELLIN